jgi:hypothetical protein
MTAIVNEVGAVCFGVTVGYITYRTLVRTVDKTSISDLAAVIAALGGAAVTKLFDPKTVLFGWYSVGLLVGMAVFFLLFLAMNGRAALGAVMGEVTRREGASTSSSDSHHSSGPRI